MSCPPAHAVFSRRSSVAAPPARTVGAGGVFVAAVALVVSASTFVSDVTGFVRWGGAFIGVLVLGALVVLPVALAAADLAVRHPRAGGIYRFARSVVPGPHGGVLGVFLGLGFLGAFFLGASGEVMAGAHALAGLVGDRVPVGVCAGLLVAGAVAANLRGLRGATWIAGALLVVMLGVRWLYGILGFAGVAETGPWEAGHLAASGSWEVSGSGGLFTGALALGFWAFVGIEGATGLVEETHDPRRAMPLGLLLGLGAILVTTVVMGTGMVGTLPREGWAGIVSGDRANAPHLAVGEAMFGAPGRVGMGVASVAAAASTLLVAFAAVPRMIQAVARDGMFFGPLSRVFARVNPRSGAPVAATWLVAGIVLLLALGQGLVIACLEGAAYLWMFRYVVLLALAALGVRDGPTRGGVLRPGAMRVVAVVGIAALAMVWWTAFSGRHEELGVRAALVLALAHGCTALSWWLRPGRLRGAVPGGAMPAPAAST